MIKAYILIVAKPGDTQSVFDSLAKIDGVKQAYQVMGPYDIVAEIEVEDLSQVPPILSQHIRTIDGVENTTSLVTFPG